MISPSGTSDARNHPETPLQTVNRTGMMARSSALCGVPHKADFQPFKKSNIPFKTIHRSIRLIMTPRMTPTTAAHPVTISASRQSPLAATSMAINGGAKKGPMLPT